MAPCSKKRMALTISLITTTASYNLRVSITCSTIRRYSYFDGNHFAGRSTHVNKLNVKADGTFDIVQQNLDGVPQLADFDPYQTVSGLTSSNNAGMGAIETNVIYHKNGKVN